VKDKDSKYGLRPEEENAVVQEIWKRDEILEFCDIMAWYELKEAISALPVTPKEVFADKIKHGDVQVTLYRKLSANTFDDIECPFYFTIEECK
jgi:hypothetical protein